MVLMAEEPRSGRITQLLEALQQGDTEAEQVLIRIVYRELRQMARHYRRLNPGGGTLETTDLIHETYVRLAGIEGAKWRDRNHFFATSAQLMRRILVDRQRARQRLKRGGAHRFVPVPADGVADAAPNRLDDWLAVDRALTRFAELDPRRARIVELRIFGGMTATEIASVLGVSEITVMRDWKAAKAWLLCELGPEPVASGLETPGGAERGPGESLEQG